LQWFPWTASTVNNLVDQYKITLVRAAMYVDEGGYLTDPSGMKTKVKTVVDAAIAKGIYVIIDWHMLNPGDPNAHTSDAKTFFQDMATTYGSKANVLYEICNEPNGVNWATVKNYATQVIPVIRAIDPDNIIIVGSPTWSQDVDLAAADPVTGYSNLVYTLHFYAGTHSQALRDKANTAMSKGLALFVSEWGTSDASGGGGVYTAEAQVWIDWMASNKISWANWSLCNKAESSAFLLSSAGMSGPWTDSQLSASGLFVKTKF
jgi:endoglucanase